MRELEDVALAFDRACRQATIPYAFVGGVAVIAWGQPRMTMDVDALVHLKENQTQTLARALEKEGLRVIADDLEDSVRDGTHATVFDQKSSWHVDVKIARTKEETKEIENAVDVPFGNGTLRIIRAEDAVAYKLKFGSDQDLADARSILARQEGKLDLKHLEELCSKLEVTQLLRRVREEVKKGAFTSS